MQFVKILATVYLSMFLCLCSDSAAFNGDQKNNDPGNLVSFDQTAPKLWAAGDKAGVYLVLVKEKNGEKGFAVFYRGGPDTMFYSGNWYRGGPAEMVLGEDRLVIYFTRGGSQSYDLQSSRTQRSLPGGLRIVSCSYGRGGMVVLAQAVEPIVLSLPLASPAQGVAPGAITPGDKVAKNRERREQQPKQAAPVAADANEPMLENTIGEQQWPLSKDDFVLITHGRDGQWRMVSVAAVPLKKWPADKTKIVVLNDVIHLFGIKSGELLHIRWNGGRFTSPETLGINNVTAVTALKVNRQVRVVTVTDERPDTPTDNTDGVIYRTGWLGRDGWVFSEPLRKSEELLLTAPLDKVAFAALGQNIAAFEWLSEQNVVFGQYSSTGDLLERFVHPIASVAEEPLPLLEWFLGPQVTTSLIVLIVLLVYWRRSDAFEELPVLPGGMFPAPLTLRAGAFFLDILIIYCLTAVATGLIHLMVYPILGDNLTVAEEYWRQAMKGNIEPHIFGSMALVWLIFCVVSVLYTSICESLYAATLGKMALRLTVVSLTDGTNGDSTTSSQGSGMAGGESNSSAGNKSAARLTARQALIRNLFRCIEFHPGIFLPACFLVVITRGRQRAGDLAARTIVVIKLAEPSPRSEAHN